MFKSVILLLPLLLLEANANFVNFFGVDTLFNVSSMPKPAPFGCVVERSWELTTSLVPDQERAREAYKILAKALPQQNVNLNSLGLIGSLEQLKQSQVDVMKEIYIKPRINFMKDKMRWKRNEVPFWIHTSGDVAATITGQVFYAEHNTKNRDINGYYVAENPFKYMKSAEQRAFEASPDFQKAYKIVNSRLKEYFKQSKDFSVDEVVASYDLCRHIIVTYDAAAKRDRVSWCKMFENDELEVFEFHEELNLQNNFWHNALDLGPMVCGIIDSLQWTIASTDKDPNGLIGTTFFTVTQQFMPFLDAMKLLKRVKATEFKKGKSMDLNRIKRIAGRLSTITIYKYNEGCSKQTEVFLNGNPQMVMYRELVGTLKRNYRC